MRVPIDEARAGDILTFKGDGILFEVLSRIIKLKVPAWDRQCWHTAVMVGTDIFIEAQFPKVRFNSLEGCITEGNIPRVYRWFDTPPPQDKIDAFCKDKIGCWYDGIVYFLTAFALLLRPHIAVWRIINRRYDCWELVWEFADEMGKDITDDYNYPFLTDFLKIEGEC